MSAASIKRRLDRLEARRPAREVPPTDAECITNFLEAKYIERCERRGERPEPFDKAATLERVRQHMIERGHDPEARY
jgi:hypothetical protein